MLKTPISFKGPAGQLEQMFDENSVFEAYKLLENFSFKHWRYNEESKMTYATLEDKAQNNNKRHYSINMSWPPSKEFTYKCDCALNKLCKHLILLAIYNKSTLDILPPFTQQIRAQGHINETFVNWLNQQSHDPFPRMARHRVIYVLSENSQQHIILTLYKAYLTQDNQYQVKADLDSSVIQKKSLPKFVSLADQKVLHSMHGFGMDQTQTFVVDSKKHKDLILSIVKTGRCFWRACYRPPLKLAQINQSVDHHSAQDCLFLTENLYLLLAENKVLNVRPESQPNQVITLSEQSSIVPKLNLKTQWVELDWKPGFIESIDVAEIKFLAGEVIFSLADVSMGAISLPQTLVEQLAACCYQLEKLPSIYAQYESPISEQFDINDRYIPKTFTSIAPLLLALQRYGWQIDIADSYRLNKQVSGQVYVQIDQQKNSGQTDWFDVEVGVKLQNESVNLLPYLIKAIKTGQFDRVKQDLLIRLDDGRFIDMPQSKIFQIIDTLNELYDSRLLKNKEKIIINQHQLLRFAEISEVAQNGADNQDIGWHGDTDIQSVIQQLRLYKALPEIPTPKGLQAILRPYQKTGLCWLNFLYQYNFHGVLADDMGLGKTLQILAHLLSLKNKQALKAPVLIVAPTSLLGNWLTECQKFTPKLNAMILTGAKRKDDYQIIQSIDLVITSYGVMARDHEKITQITWHTLVLDEAQAIKNRKTQVAKMAKKLKASHRLCLSGTPMENHLGEIWSLFDFLMPGFMGTEKVFQQLYQWPIEKHQDQIKLQALQQRLAPFILRRTKAEVANDLPEKNEIIKLIELTDQQANVYESIRITMSEEIRKAVSHQQSNQILIGNALLRLRQVCCHPALLKLDSVNEIAESAKLDWLSMAVPNLVEEGRRILIFSSFTSMLQIIADKLDELKIYHLKLTGATQPHVRTRKIAAFQTGDVPVFLISLKAGGAGINLTAADTVIHFDPWWNPAAEQQASDRAHRIGQDKQVFVYKLITRGTVEEKIYKMQQQKQQLADQLLAQTSHIAEILSEHQWESMLAPLNVAD
ncbi:MAG: DEAD/DEAH box helicase [Marinicella sp.]